MNISFAQTTSQVKAGIKDVTRRLGWKNLKPGQVLYAIEKGQGLKKGERVKYICLIKVVSVRRESLDRMITDPAYGRMECWREGFPSKSPSNFIAMFCRSHKPCVPSTIITRIEFIYMDRISDDLYRENARLMALIEAHVEEEK